MRRRHSYVAVVLLVALSPALATAQGCSAVGSRAPGGGTSAGTSGTGGAGSDSTAVSTGGQGGDPVIIAPGGGGADAGEDVFVNLCGSQCGPVELCDPDHLGLDDDCNGQVDEGCPCAAGEAHFCFKGDPSYRGTPGCFDGTELCSEQGTFGECLGGVHAAPPDDCFQTDATQCHAIASPPFATAHLRSGLGNFGAGALPGSETFAVQCPSGVPQCPTVTAADEFQPLQSGEYLITYGKLVAGDPTPRTCTFPLEVGAPGLRVELTWEHPGGDHGVDLDLHLHQPGSTQPWGIQPGVPQDCCWSNCVVDNFVGPEPTAPRWFADWPTMPPSPVNWYVDPLHQENNTCYFAPRGVGQLWQTLGRGCHDPRLDVDNVQCDVSVTDPADPDFCTPENINVDFPPAGQWMRIGVHYYWNHDQTYDVHPRIKVFCDGALAADLGPAGYYTPEAPVTFPPSAGATVGSNRFWMVADVAFLAGECDATRCTVRPLHADPATRTPFFVTDSAAVTQFVPPYPPLP